MSAITSASDDEMQAEIERLRQQLAQPIDMVLHCPACGMQHIDGPEAGKQIWGSNFESPVVEVGGWTNPPHCSHLCHGCGHIWRPADVATNGVPAVKTKGKDDSPVVQLAQQVPAALVSMVDAAMAEMSNIHPPLRRSECERLICAALSAAPAQPEQTAPASNSAPWPWPLETDKPAAQDEPSAAFAWHQGYRAGINDERTSEANIGVAGFGAKVEPNRQNPYAHQLRFQPRNLKGTS